MDAEQIAREIVTKIVLCNEPCALINRETCGCFIKATTALREAHRAGYEAAREQAAGVVDEFDTTFLDLSDSDCLRWLSKDIRAMEPSR